MGLVAFLVVVKVIFLLFPAAFPGADQVSAFYWTTILVVAAVGFVGLVLSRRAGFPDIRDARVSDRRRFLVPALVGLVYGVETVLRAQPARGQTSPALRFTSSTKPTAMIYTRD